MSNSKTNLGVALVKECCPVCGKAYDGLIVMNSRLTEKDAKEVESMHGKVVGFMDDPCAQCQEYMQQGIILVGIENGEGERCQKLRAEAQNLHLEWKQDCKRYGKKSTTAQKSYQEAVSKLNEAKNPVRTGGFWVLKDDAVMRIFQEHDPAFLQSVMNARVLQVERDACDAIGLVIGNTDPKSQEG